MSASRSLLLSAALRRGVLDALASLRSALLDAGGVAVFRSEITGGRSTMSGVPLPAPTLETERLRLRPFLDDDADAMWELHSSRAVLRYWDSPPWQDRSRATEFLARSRAITEDATGARLAVDLREGPFIGWCAVTSWNPTHRTAHLGYVFAEKAWGQGYGTEAVGALVDWAFDALDLNRVQADLDTRNTASMRVLEKLGFRREGHLREDCVVDGAVSDTYVYGLLRSDRTR